MTEIAHTATPTGLPDGVAAITIVWSDNNGIPRARVVPAEQWPTVCEIGVGVTPLFAVFDSHDAITFAHPGLANASGDIRLVPVSDRLVPLANQPGMAWVPGRQVSSEGDLWLYDQRGALERQVAAAAEVGLDFRAGYELEFLLSAGAGDEPTPAHHGPAYSAKAVIDVDRFAVDLLEGLAANGVPVGQFHAEYGTAQLELSIAPRDPVTAGDLQLLARQTIHAVAAHHGFRASFSPLALLNDAGNGWHLHTSVWRGNINLLAGDTPEGEGASYLAGLLRDLAAIVAVTAPSEVSRARLRPGFFSSAYGYWGIENREAALRFIPGTKFTGRQRANVELKPSDASANPYLAAAAVIAAGLGGITDNLTLPPPISDDVHGWTAERRTNAGVTRLPQTTHESVAALQASPRVSAALGADLLNAFAAVRRADAAWAADKSLDEVVHEHRWRY